MTLFEFIVTAEGITKISLVERPAIGVDFLTFKKQARQQFKEMKKGYLVGAAIIPDKPIYRIDTDGKEYYGYFSKDTTRKIAELYMEKARQKDWNIEHGDDVEGVTLVESWIVEGEDKATRAGLSVPDGTWMVGVKVDNEDLKKDIIEKGSIKGFSIEGLFDVRPVTEQLRKVVEEKIEAALLSKVEEKVRGIVKAMK
jgi:hypothetical protein